MALDAALIFSKEISDVGNESSPAPFIIFSSYFSAANICFSTFITIQIVNGTEKKTIPTFGLFTGAAQIILGAGSYSTVPEMKALSIANIAIGSATMLLSTWNLIANKNTVKKKNNFRFI